MKPLNFGGFSHSLFSLLTCRSKQGRLRGQVEDNPKKKKKTIIVIYSDMAYGWYSYMYCLSNKYVCFFWPKEKYVCFFLLEKLCFVHSMWTTFLEKTLRNKVTPMTKNNCCGSRKLNFFFFWMGLESST